MEVHCDKAPGASLPALPAIAVARIGLHRSVRPGFCALIEQRHETTGPWRFPPRAPGDRRRRIDWVRPGFCALIEQRHEATGAYGAAELNNATGCGSWRYGTAEFDWDFAC